MMSKWKIYLIWFGGYVFFFGILGHFVNNLKLGLGYEILASIVLGILWFVSMNFILNKYIVDKYPEESDQQVNFHNIEYKIGSDIPKEALYALYEDAGWIAYTNDMEKLMKAVANSLMVVSAWSEGELVGLVRVIGDGFVILYIQDILVKANYKRYGIGSSLLKMVLGEFAEVRQIVLLTEDAEETRGFYESYGFKSCDDGRTVAFAIQK